MRFILYVFSVIMLDSCTNQEPFDREQELFSYIKDVQGIQLSDSNQLIFLISNKACNCTGDPKEIIPNNFSTNKLRKTILMERKDTSLINALNKLSNTKIYLDTLSQMAAFGLSNSTDFIFEIKDKKIGYWNYMSIKTDSIIGSRYKK